MSYLIKYCLFDYHHLIKKISCFIVSINKTIRNTNISKHIEKLNLGF